MPHRWPCHTETRIRGGLSPRPCEVWVCIRADIHPQMPDKTAVHPTAGWSGRDGFWKTLEGRLGPDPCIYHMEVGADAKALHVLTASLGRPFREKERTKRGVT